ncbi:MAG: hypothetical protein IJS17_03915 [Clostridia bacterium]|nr:hypothetical protein [Clostridia bacterium]
MSLGDIKHTMIESDKGEGTKIEDDEKKLDFPGLKNLFLSTQGKAMIGSNPKIYNAELDKINDNIVEVPLLTVDFEKWLKDNYGNEDGD